MHRALPPTPDDPDSPGPARPARAGAPPVGPRRTLPAVVVAALAVVAAAAVAALVTLLPVADVTDRDAQLVGERESVRLTAPDGTTVDVVARLDTGATVTRIDADVADRLGLQASDADRDTVATDGGVVRRPTVDLAVDLAGRSLPARVTVAEQPLGDAPVVVGRDLLDGLTVAVGRSQLADPTQASSPSALATFLVAQSSAVDPASLLALLPLAVLVVVVLRGVVGVSTLGTFAPILLTVSFLQVGLLPSLGLVGLVVLTGLLVEPLLRRSQLPRVARLAVLIGFASVLLQGLATLTGLVGAADSWGAAFPLIVAAALVEKLHEEWELEGMGRALAAAARTVAVAVVALPVLLAPTVRLLAANSPIALALACTLLSWLVGTYRGLRLNELVRFRFVRDHAAVGGGS